MIEFDHQKQIVAVLILRRPLCLLGRFRPPSFCGTYFRFFCGADLYLLAGTMLWQRCAKPRNVSPESARTCIVIGKNRTVEK